MSRGYILVTDDDNLFAELVVNILSREGYEVATAANGALCLALIERRIPDVILLDANMPVRDGFETLKALKADPVLKNIPVVMMTAQRGAADVIKAKHLGVHGYLAKPFEPDHLTRQIAKAMKLQHALRIAEPPTVNRVCNAATDSSSSNCEFLD